MAEGFRHEDDQAAVTEGYYSQAFHVALGILRRPEDAEDAVQEAFLSAYRSFGGFQGKSKPSTVDRQRKWDTS